MCLPSRNTPPPAGPCPPSLCPRGAGLAARRAVRPRPACPQARAAAARRSKGTSRARRGEGRPWPRDPHGRPGSAGGAATPESAQRSRTGRGRKLSGRGAQRWQVHAPRQVRRPLPPPRALPGVAGPAQWRRSAAGEHSPARVPLFGNPGAGAGRVLGCRPARTDVFHPITQILKCLSS